MKRIPGILLLLAVILNVGWIALNTHSNVWIPVPKDKQNTEGGRVFVHMNWYRDEGFFIVPMLTAVLCIVALGFHCGRKKDRSKSPNQPLDQRVQGSKGEGNHEEYQTPRTKTG